MAQLREREREREKISWNSASETFPTAVTGLVPRPFVGGDERPGYEAKQL